MAFGGGLLLSRKGHRFYVGGRVDGAIQVPSRNMRDGADNVQRPALTKDGVMIVEVGHGLFEDQKLTAT